MKIIVIGTSLSGKTTLAQYLKVNKKISVLEVDDELTRYNNGEYPVDSELKHKVLIPKIIQDILNKDEVIFFTNTDYFTKDDLQKAKEKGFRIIQLDLSLNDLKERNKKRIVEQGYEDMTPWFSGMVDYQKKMRDFDLVAYVIDASQSTEKIANELLKLIK